MIIDRLLLRDIRKMLKLITKISIDSSISDEDIDKINSPSAVEELLQKCDTSQDDLNYCEDKIIKDVRRLLEYGYPIQYIASLYPAIKPYISKDEELKRILENKPLNK